MSYTQRVIDELREIASLIDDAAEDLAKRSERSSEALSRYARRVRECADDLGDD